MNTKVIRTGEANTSGSGTWRRAASVVQLLSAATGVLASVLFEDAYRG